MTPARKRSGM